MGGCRDNLTGLGSVLGLFFQNVLLGFPFQSGERRVAVAVSRHSDRKLEVVAVAKLGEVLDGCTTAHQFVLGNVDQAKLSSSLVHAFTRSIVEG